jgi:hypothetical protein
MTELCDRCKCCSADYEMVPCWSCGGFCGDWDDDEWGNDGWCDACEGEGEIPVKMCCGSCDENGKHKPREVTA